LLGRIFFEEVLLHGAPYDVAEVLRQRILRVEPLLKNFDLKKRFGYVLGLSVFVFVETITDLWLGEIVITHVYISTIGD